MSIQCLYLILHLLDASFFQGVMAIMPLSIAVIPWGILAGSMAVNAGLSFAKAFAMSSLFLLVQLNW
jgi:predicted branched-subunit amino acid permease